VDGDQAADRSLLAASFLGVYSSGFSNRDDHAGQLQDGPTIACYQISDARLHRVSSDAYLLSYLATYERAASAGSPEWMYVSSLWERHEGEWINTFSQDTAAELGSTT